MKYNFLKLILQVFFLVIFTNSCKKNALPENVKQAIKFAGENKSELLKVIEFYSKNPEDSLKLKAAFYLIGNMPYHSFTDEDKFYSPIFDEVGQFRKKIIEKDTSITKEILSIKVSSRLKISMDSMERESGQFREDLKQNNDVNYLNSEYLIKNIDLAFKAYEENPLKLCENFEEFLHFLLPYRAIGDPIQFNRRKELYTKYRWVFDSLKVSSLDKIVKNISDELDLKAFELKHDNYKHFYTSKQIEKIKIASCIELSSYMVNLLRAIGIPSGIDYIKKWGDEHNSVNHTWIFYKTKKGFKAINSGAYRSLNHIYEISSIPKVFRQTFHPNLEGENDVTSLYRKTYNVEIDNIFLKNTTEEKTFLGVYDSSYGVFNIAQGKNTTDKKVLFADMGNDIVYFPFSNFNNVLKPINYPFELTKDGTIIFFSGSEDVHKKVKLLRKYPPFSLRRKKVKQRRMQSINGLVLQGSNLDIDTLYKDLYITSKLNTSHCSTIKLKDNIKYIYYRLKEVTNQKHIDIAAFTLLDSNNSDIKNDYEIMINNKKSADSIYLTDENPLSFIRGKGLEIKYSFKNKKEVSGFRIQPRNDGNHIDVGDDYELFYWNKDWKSLGRQRAIDTFLTYRNIPKDFLYLLKNTTKGREEFVFKLDKEGNQFWVGSSDYENNNSLFAKSKL